MIARFRMERKVRCHKGAVENLQCREVSGLGIPRMKRPWKPTLQRTKGRPTTRNANSRVFIGREVVAFITFKEPLIEFLVNGKT
jgi:hypothetical protein